MKRLIVLGLAVLAVLALAGCSKPPDALSKQAVAALQSAQDAGAPEYAPDSWNRAKQAVDQVQAAIDSQAKRFALFRSYGKARTLAADALRLAQQALADTNAKKKQLSDQASSALSEVTALIESARSQVGRLPRTSGLNAAKLRAEIAVAGGLLEQARSKLADDAYDAALATASRAREAVTKVLRDIERATGGPKTRKR